MIADVHLRRRLDGVRAASLGAVVHPRFRADPVHLLFSGPGQRRHQQLDQWCTLDDKGVYLLLTELVASLRPWHRALKKAVALCESCTDWPTAKAKRFRLAVLEKTRS